MPTKRGVYKDHELSPYTIEVEGLQFRFSSAKKREIYIRRYNHIKERVIKLTGSSDSKMLSIIASKIYIDMKLK